MTDRPLKVKELNTIGEATSKAFTWMMDYDRRGDDRVNQDITKTLRREYEVKSQETERVRVAVYFVLWTRS